MSKAKVKVGMYDGTVKELVLEVSNDNEIVSELYRLYRDEWEWFNNEWIYHNKFCGSRNQG